MHQRSNKTIKMNQNKRPKLNTTLDRCQRDAGYLYALITGRRSVSRRNRCSWYLRLLNKEVSCDSIEEIENDGKDFEKQDDGQSDLNNVDPNSLIERGFSTLSTEEQFNFQQSEQNNTSEKDIYLVSITSSTSTCASMTDDSKNQQDQRGISNSPMTTPTHLTASVTETKFLVTPSTHVLYLSKNIATSIILDLSPSVVSVSPQNDCVFLDSMFDALKRVLHLLVKPQAIPSSVEDRQQFVITPKVFVSVIAYTPFIVAKNNQVLVKNRRISANNIDQVLVEIWLCLSRLIQEIHELVSSNCGFNLNYVSTSQNNNGSAFIFPQPPGGGSIIRHPGSVLEDIFQLAIFSSQLMPKLSRLSMITITDGLFSSSNDLSLFRLYSIAASFVSLGMEAVHPDGCFGYTPYSDLMRFVAKTTQGFYITHKDLIESSRSIARAQQVPLIDNPLAKLFYWTLHSTISDERFSCTPKVSNFNSFNPIQVNPIDMRPEHIARFFCIDQPVDAFDKSMLSLNLQAGCYDEQPPTSQNYHDWRLFKQLERNLDADFEQVLSCLLREGYLIKSIQFKHRETSRIVARLVLHWKHNLDLEQELTAPYWSTTDPFELNDSNTLILRPFNAPLYGDTFCELYIHGSYSFLHNLYCDKKVKRRTDYRDLAYKQFKQLIDGVVQTQDRLQFLSRFYREPSLAKVPSYLLHGNSLLYEQPHTHKLTSTMENVIDETKTNEFQEYWHKISYVDPKTWTNLMHVHSVRLVLEHDQPKYKTLHCQNTNGRYPQVQCRRALSGISNFIKSYASFALLEDSTYVKFIYNKDDDLRDIGTSSTKGFIVIQIKKILPTVVINLMFTSGILDSHRVQIVSHIERCLRNCKIRSGRTSTMNQSDNILKTKTVYSIGDSCCTLLKSPLERMFRLYSRHFISDHLSHNLSIGLPGSFSITATQQQQQQQQQSSVKINKPSNQGNKTRSNNNLNQSALIWDQHYQDSESDYSISRHNLIYSKYLYGIRVVHTVGNLPNNLVQLIANNVLVKISGILVNIRIKEGFRIALSNSGILSLVVEFGMGDHSYGSNASTCLCQYIVFPPIITSCSPTLEATTTPTTSSNGATNAQQQSLAASVNSNELLASSKPNSLTNSNELPGSLIKNNLASQQDCSISRQIPTMIIKNDNKGEIKVVREYWIEQQYGTSAKSSGNYHETLENMRYPEIVDHLFLTDSDVFECLLNYELLQLQCDKLSPFYDLDKVLATKSDSMSRHNESTFSPTTSISSSSSSSSLSAATNSSTIFHSNSTNLPSKLIYGCHSKDACPKIPLLEFSYEFSLVNFLDYCQKASLTVLMFRDESEYFESTLVDLDQQQQQQQQQHGPDRRQNSTDTLNKIQPLDQMSTLQQQQPIIGKNLSRKMSMDVGKSERDYCRREHRSSYDNLTTSPNIFVNPICSPSLNHLFLETLHKRLKQMHDKEHKLSESDQKRLARYLMKRTISFREDAARFDGCEPEFANGGAIDDERDEDDTFSLDNDKSSTLRRSTNEFEFINWRCFLRKGNQENLLIVLIPATLGDVSKWMAFVRNSSSIRSTRNASQESVCPIFVFRCSSSMVNEQVLSHLSCLGGSGANKTPQGQFKAQAKISTTRRHLKSRRPLAKIDQFESDLALHFGQPCRYMSQLMDTNDELDTEVFPIMKLGTVSNLNQCTTEEKTLEIVHFRAFLRKVKNTVLKSRFSSLNDAYLSELFVHKDDILYYMNNVDLDTQKKYHVSSQLKNLAEFIKSYQDYMDSLPKEPVKQCNQLLNSILLQKCGLFINQPIARFNEANPLMKQLNDRKLLYLMRCNYKIELPILEENLSGSSLLKSFIVPTRASSHLASSNFHNHHHHHHNYVASNFCSPSQIKQQPSLTHSNQIGTQLSGSAHGSPSPNPSGGRLAGGDGQQAGTVSSLGRSNDGCRLMEIRCGSMGATKSTSSAVIGSPSASFNVANNSNPLQSLPPAPPSSSGPASSRVSPRYSSTSCLTLNNLTSPSNDSFILEAFRGSAWSMEEISGQLLDELMVAPTNGGLEQSSTIPTLDPAGQLRLSPGLPPDAGLRHEAHMAEVLRRKSERKESHHYRRVLKSKSGHNHQSHSAIDNALKKFDSLGRLEHFCLTPLLFSPSWRSKLAPVRDHTIEPHSNRSNSLDDGYHHQDAPSDPEQQQQQLQQQQQQQQQQVHSACSSQAPKFETRRHQQQLETDERWHQMVCNSYIKEYEQYIQTLGFNSVQIRFPPSGAASGAQASAASGTTSAIGSATSRLNSRRSSKNFELNDRFPLVASSTFRGTTSGHLNSSWNSNVATTQTAPKKRDSIATVSNALVSNATNAYDTGYLVKFLSSGCLVFKVGFCKPYVYSILYSIEGDRFSGTNNKFGMATFLDELDNVKVTMHLHSFTYDYHLRSIYSYISGRQMTFSPGYHLISFVDDFRKYYQKAPNYARNHILSGEICMSDLRVSGQQLYNYIVTHSSAYSLEVLEMASSIANHLSTGGAGCNLLEPNTVGLAQKLTTTTTSASGSGDQLRTDLFSGGSLGSGSIRDVVVQEINNSSRSHANDYVLIELKREKVRYRDGKDPDVFECGLLITHDVHDSTLDGKNCLILKYFLLLTNQRDLYPKLVHKDDAMIAFGCHRPIRLGVAQLNAKAGQRLASNAPTSDCLAGAGDTLATTATTTATTTPTNRILSSQLANDEPVPNVSARPESMLMMSAAGPGLDVVGLDAVLATRDLNSEAPPSIITMTTTTTATSTATTATTAPSDQDDFQSSDLLSSGEISGPQSILSTANSIQSGTSSGGQSQRAFVVASNATVAASLLPSGALISAGTRRPAAELGGAGGTASGQAMLGSPTETMANYPSLAKAQLQLQLHNPHHQAYETEMAKDALNLSQVDGLSQSKPDPEQPAQVASGSHSLAACGPAPLCLPAMAAAAAAAVTTTSPSSPAATSGSMGQAGEAADQQQLRSASAASRHGPQASGARERAICDEEITYLGYFSSDEMDMLSFLQEKTNNLRQHIERIVRQAELHYQRDLLWQKLMQRSETCSSAGNHASAMGASGGAGPKLLAGYDQQLPLSTDELAQLLQIVETIDLASLDAQLAGLTGLHVNWYLKLVKAFGELRQSSVNQHRIFHVKAAPTRSLLLFIDPKCTTAFILLAVDQERGGVELSMLLRDRHECGRLPDGPGSSCTSGKRLSSAALEAGKRDACADGFAGSLELEQDCQQLINDFVNFCATFMWSTFLT